MNLAGTPDDWIDLIDSLVPDILKLVISAWEQMPTPGADALEDPTTEELSRWLRRNRDINLLPLQVHVQMVELGACAGDEQGRMDIVFLPLIAREDVYFCLECKRLNVQYDKGVRSYASEYVTYGMLRFIHEKYSARLRNGGMLGYVLDGNVSQAILKVSGIIKKRHEELGMQPPGEMLRSSILPDETSIRETRHSRRFNNDKFVMHHLFARAGK